MCGRAALAHVLQGLESRFVSTITTRSSTAERDDPFHGKPIKTMASSVLLWFRNDLSREAARAYWQGGHAQLVARNPALEDYRQHHFSTQCRGLWPELVSVETVIPERRRIDGMPEVRLKGVISTMLHSAYGRRVLADEVNVFKRTILYATMPGGGRWFRSGYGQPVGARCVVLMRRREGVKAADFERFIHEELSPCLDAAPGVLELRTQVFMAWKEGMWNSPGVQHDNPADGQFHASLVIGAHSHEQLLNALEAVARGATRQRQMACCQAIHAYEVEETFSYCRQGRPTLPQVKAEPKPGLEPAKRQLPPVPKRSLQRHSDTPMPTALKLPISGSSAEDVVADGLGHLICGVGDGRILRIDPRSRQEETLCSTGGRPLGLEMGPDGRLIICDAHKGLLSFDFSRRQLTTLVQFVDTVPLRFCSNATMGADGTIWFTESTTRFDFENFMGAFFEHRPSGRLLRRDPNGKVTVLLENLYFPNGLTLNQDESALLFVETLGYRLSRLWVAGERAGQLEVLADNLPGFPDNVSRLKDGRFWVAMVNTRSAALDRLGQSASWLRKALWRLLPQHPGPEENQTAWVMAFDESGNVLMDLQNSDLAFGEITGVAELGGRLYCGSVDPRQRALLEINLAELNSR